MKVENSIAVRGEGVKSRVDVLSGYMGRWMVDKFCGEGFGDLVEPGCREGRFGADIDCSSFDSTERSGELNVDT